MAEEHREPEQEPEETSLQRGRWELEEAVCVDDTITDLTAITQNSKGARDLVIRSPNVPEGESLEQDFGYIQCEPPRRELVNLLHFMKRISEVFQGHVYRDIGLLSTVLVEFGTIKIEEMLKDRKDRLARSFKDWVDQNQTYSTEGFKWRKLTPVEKGHLYYRFNFFALDRTIRARLHNIKSEYDIPLSVLVQLAIIEATRTSRLIPLWLKELLDEEHDNFQSWLNLKETIDNIQHPKALPEKETQ